MYGINYSDNIVSIKLFIYYQELGLSLLNYINLHGSILKIFAQILARKLKLNMKKIIPIWVYANLIQPM